MKLLIKVTLKWQNLAIDKLLYKINSLTNRVKKLASRLEETNNRTQYFGLL